MSEIDNVFIARGGTDVITLSVFNRETKYDEYGYIPKVHPGEKLPPLSGPIPEVPEGEEARPLQRP